MIFLLTLVLLNHTMDLTIERATGKRSWADGWVRRYRNQKRRTPKVQIWIWRNQTKLSGKRTLLRINSGKFREEYRRC